MTYDWDALRRAAHAHVEPVAALAMQICAVPAPTGDEARRAAFVAEALRTRGYAPEFDDVGNVYARRGNRGGLLVLALAHTDTVFPHGTPIDVSREGNILRGPGIGDNSLSVAAMLGVLDLLDELQVRTDADLVVCGNVGEEGLGNLRGARAAVARYRDHVGAVLAIDGDFGWMCHTAVGSQRLRVTVRGPGGHSYHDFGAPSATHGLARAVAAVADLSVPHEPRVTFNVGTIRGGTSVNTIAQEAEALIDMRSTDPHALADMVGRVKIAVAGSVGDGLQVAFETVGERPAGALSAGAPLVRAAVDTLRWLGVVPQTEAASTDANIPISLGIPAICVGVAHGHGAHTREEYVDITLLGDGLAQIARLIVEAATLASGRRTNDE